MRLGHCVLASTILLAPAAVAGQADGNTLQQCATALADQADFSGEILISHGGATVGRAFKGRLSDEGSRPIDASTRFNIGSASKMFTAVAIGQLLDSGKLRLDEPIGDIVSGLTPEASRVTIAQLLNHTSGLGDFFKPENMETMLRARTASDILPLIAGEKPAFPPGSKFTYSNSGFVLLGVAIERVSRLSYGEYLRRNIFVPADMTSTGLNPTPLDTLAVGMTYGGMGSDGSAPPPGLVLLPPQASGSARPELGGSGLVLIGPDGRRIDPGNAGGPRALQVAPGAREGYGSPAGGLFSTVSDLDHFASALEDGRILSASTFRLFTSPQVKVAEASPQGPARYYGFGFGLAEDGGRHWVGHNGGTLGANAEIWFDPESHWTLAVLANRDPPVATKIARRLRPIAGNELSGCR